MLMHAMEYEHSRLTYRLHLLFSQNGRTPLMRSCLEGKKEIVVAILEAKPRVSLVDNVSCTFSLFPSSLELQWGRTALMYTASKGDIDTLQLLLQAGTDLDHLDLV